MYSIQYYILFYSIQYYILFFCFQAQSDDDDVGPEEVAVNVDGRDGFMDEFFAEVSLWTVVNTGGQN